MADISIYDQLKEIFEGIRDERRMASNTATRIGNAFLALLEYAKSVDKPISGDADTAAKLQTARSIWGQMFDGTADVMGDMTGVGTITPSSGDLKIVGNLLVTGGITMYATDGVSSGIMDAILVDNDTIGINDKGQLCVIKAIGGGTVTAISVNGSRYNPSDGVINLPDYPTSLAWDKITGKPGSLSGYGIKDAYTKKEVDDLLEALIISNADSATKLQTARNIWGQSFDGTADVSGNMTGVGSITPTGTDLKIVGNLLVTGGITMYATDGVSSGIMDAILVDNDTIGINDKGQLCVIKAIGGGTVTAISVNGSRYNPSDGVITLPDYPTSLAWDKITGKPSTFTPSSHSHTFASLSDKPSTLAGYGITNAYTKTETDNILKAFNAASATKLQTARNIWGQSFDGTADVSGNMTGVGSITPTGTDLKIVGNLLVTGGITMYATDGVSSALMDAILVDGKTIGKDPSTGALYAINTGNVKGIIVNGNTYNSVDAAGLITLPNYPTELSWSAITGKPTSFTPSSHTHNYTSTVKLGTVEYKVANNVVSLPAYPTIPNLAKGTTAGTGNVVTDLSVSTHTITLTKGITALTSHQTIYALTLQRGGADVGTYTPNSKAATLNVALPTFAEILSKPTTLGGFGITDAYTKTEADNRYVNVAGDTMTGLLTAKTGASHNGIKLGDTYLTSIGGDVILQNNNALRFGADDWDYNVWAGLKYKSTNKTIYLGLADGTIFAANSAQSGGNILTPGISNIYVGNNTTNKVLHTGNYTATLDTRYYTESEINTKLTNGSVTKVGTATVGSATLPMYLNAGTPTACTASSVFSSLAASGSNISVTVAGQNRKLTVPYATNADTLDGYHESSFLHLSGGTMTGQIKRAGQDSSWIKGRNNAALYVNSANGYSVLSSIKSSNGSWQIGHYSADSHKDYLLFGYSTDTAYSSNNNSDTTKIKFSPTGTVYAPYFSGALSGNAATASKWQTSRTLSLTGSVTGSVSMDGSGDVSMATTTNHTHSYLTDRTNSTATYFNYGAAAITTASYLAAWNGYELRAMTPDNVRNVINAPSKTGSGASGTWGISVSGKSAYADAVRDPDYHDYSHRRTSANIRFGDDVGLHHFLATSSMTTGYPGQDGFIIHQEWDNSLKWAGQIATITNGGDALMKIRSQCEGTWGDWRTVALMNVHNSGLFRADKLQSVGYIDCYGHLYLDSQNASSSTEGKSQLIFASSGTQHVVLSSNTGALIINPNTTSPTGQIVLRVGTSANSEFAGNLLTKGGITMCYSSDRRLKTGIRKVTDAPKKLLSLGGVYEYNYTAEEVARNMTYGGKHIGLIYQNVKGGVLDRMAYEREDGYGALNYLDPSFISLLAAVEIDHEGRIKNTESKIERMKRQIKELEDKIKQMERRAA